MNQTRLTSLAPAVAGILALMAAAGCASKGAAGASGKSAKPAALTASDFRGTSNGGVYTPRQRERTPASPQPEAGFEDVIAVVGTPAPVLARPALDPSPQAEAAATPSAGGDARAASSSAPRAIAVDELVGQINGKPVYANEFFSGLDARLRQEAQTLPLREFERLLLEESARELNVRMRDELLLAEFQSSLTPQARVGVLNFIESLRSDILSLSRGSETVAEERLQTEKGRTLEEEVRYRADRMLLGEQLRRTVLNKVYVSSRDVRRYYEQNPQLFQATNRATFRVIQVPQSDESRIAEVKQLLADGVPFADVAGSFSDFKRVDNGLYERDIGPKGLGQTEIFGAPTLNGPAQQLTVGQTTQPIAFDGGLWWLHLEEVESTPAISLYDAQLRIEDHIRSVRLNEEEQRYLGQLFVRSNVTDRNEMLKKLMVFGMARYRGVRVDGGSGAPGSG